MKYKVIKILNKKFGAGMILLLVCFVFRFLAAELEEETTVSPVKVFAVEDSAEDPPVSPPAEPPAEPVPVVPPVESQPEAPTAEAVSEPPAEEGDVAPPPNQTPRPTPRPTPQEVGFTPALEAISFDSSSFNFTQNITSKMGVYISSAGLITEYEICLEFDADMLRYISGASEREGNLLYVRGSGSGTAYRNMLHFEPLQSGTTTLKVQSVKALGAQSQEIAIDFSDLAQITITPSEIISSNLHILTVSPIGISFSYDLFNYEIEVGTDVLELYLEAIPQDERAEVLISNPNLVMGQNAITVTVIGTDKTSVYTIQVLRTEPEVLTELSLEAPSSAIETDAALVSNLGKVPQPYQFGPEVVSLGYYLSWKIAIAFFVALVLLVIILLKAIESFLSLPKYKMDKEIRRIALERKVIDVQKVSMKFRLAQEGSSSLKEYIIRQLKGQNVYRTLNALQKISFEVNQGDIIGIIGTNGSGKSTLLKIISGALKPTEGQVIVDRRKIQMLTLGTGFDMELTARENVYLNGAIIGYAREYIDEKFDDIIAFAELEDFVDERVKNFSTGMVSRLGFAIATIRNAPEILILDEVISVGDIRFSKKSMARIQEMIHSGSTVLLVTHSMATIRQNCTKVIWIEKGILRLFGEPERVCKAYEECILKN